MIDKRSKYIGLAVYAKDAKTNEMVFGILIEYSKEKAVVTVPSGAKVNVLPRTIVNAGADYPNDIAGVIWALILFVVTVIFLAAYAVWFVKCV